MTSGELLKYRNGLLMAQAYNGQALRPAFGLTLPRVEIVLLTQAAASADKRGCVGEKFRFSRLSLSR